MTMRLSSPPSDGLRRDDALELLQLLADLRATDGWDGIDTFAVSDEVVDITKRLLLALPAWCPTPSIGTDRDGAPELEWLTERGYLKFSIGVVEHLVDWQDEEELGQATLEHMEHAGDLPVPLLGFLAAMFLSRGLREGRMAQEPVSPPARTSPVAMAFAGNRRL